MSRARRGAGWWAVLASLAAVAGAAAGACAPPDGVPPRAGGSDERDRALARVAAAGDVRPAGGAELAVLVDATRSADAAVRSAGVRALGRLEDPGLSDEIAHVLDDPAREVRAEAANALAQAWHGRPAGPALAPLAERARQEGDPDVLAALARSAGRLALEGAERALAARLLGEITRGRPDAVGNDAADGPRSDAPPERVLGAVLGIESFARTRGGGGEGPEALGGLSDPLRELLVYGLADDSEGPGAEVSTRIRTAAFRALGASGGIAAPDVELGLEDASSEVRLAAARHLTALGGPVRERLAARALADAAARVRWAAVAALDGARPREGRSCELLLAAAAADADTGVRLRALDALSRPCVDRGAQVGTLDAAVRAMPPDDLSDWHEAAHALAALAALEPASAARHLPALQAHPSPFARAWAARAAALVGDREALAVLARDASANVRTAALRELAALDGPGAAGALVAALAEGDDPQLLLEAARPLTGGGGGGDREVAGGALATLDRISRARHETLRDPRLALLDLARARGGPGWAARVEPYLEDYDPLVATRAAEILDAWRGTPHTPAPRPPERLPPPTAADLAEMGAVRIRLHMARGGEIDIVLAARSAPTNALRFLSLARAGALDGLTFHRVAPNFVIQGLSPGANEYAGHGTYTRDEVGLDVHWRGTVGISTRGRDTGDGQIFINLADNTRLDHDYTVVGKVLEGMEVVDRVLEGDVVTRLEVLRVW